MTFSTYNKFTGNLISGNSGVGLVSRSWRQRSEFGQPDRDRRHRHRTPRQAAPTVVVFDVSGRSQQYDRVQRRGFGVCFGPISSSITGNSIHDNGNLGIGIGNPIPINPTLASAASDGTQTTVVGTAPGATTIELFSNMGCDPSGFGEGQTSIASVAVRRGPSRSSRGPVPVGLVLTATTRGSSQSRNLQLRRDHGFGADRDSHVDAHAHADADQDAHRRRPPLRRHRPAHQRLPFKS